MQEAGFSNAGSAREKSGDFFLKGIDRVSEESIFNNMIRFRRDWGENTRKIGAVHKGLSRSRCVDNVIAC